MNSGSSVHVGLGAVKLPGEIQRMNQKTIEEGCFDGVMIWVGKKVKKMKNVRPSKSEINKPSHCQNSVLFYCLFLS